MINDILTGLLILYLVWDKIIHPRFELSFHNKELELTFWRDGIGTVIFTSNAELRKEYKNE